MKINPFSKTLLLIFSATLLAACTTFRPASKPLPPIRVEYTQWWGDYTLLVAQEKGYFTEEGVSVEPVYYPIFSDLYSDLAAGQIDAAMIPSGDVMNIAIHTPVKIIGLSDDGSYMPIVAKPEINSIQDLRGKAVGTLVGTQYELLVSEMLASARMHPADVTIQYVDPEKLSEALARNEVQAGFSWEPFTSQAIAAGAHVLYPTDNTARLFPDTIAFRQSVIDQRPRDIQAFIRAWYKAVNYRLDHVEETRQIAAKYIGIPVEKIEPDPDLNIYTFEDVLAAYSTTRTDGSSIFNIAQKTADYLVISGILAARPDLEAIITAEFILQK